MPCKSFSAADTPDVNDAQMIIRCNYNKCKLVSFTNKCLC